METSLKTGFAQIFSCCPKNWVAQNLGGAAAPLAPPGPYPYVGYSVSTAFCSLANMLQSVKEFNWQAKQDEHLEYSRVFHHIHVKYWSRMWNPPASIPAKRAQYVTYTWNYHQEYKRRAPILSLFGRVRDNIWLFTQCRGLTASASLSFPALFAIPIDILVTQRLSDLHRRGEC